MVNQKPRIVAITGSTKFKDSFRKVAANETLAGNIVLTVHVFRHDPEWAHLTEEQCTNLDKLFAHFIEMCDELIVVNEGGYIGEGTQRDIDKALQLGKPVRYAFCKHHVRITFIENVRITFIENTSADIIGNYPAAIGDRYLELQVFLAENGVSSDYQYELGTYTVDSPYGGIFPDGSIKITTTMVFPMEDPKTYSAILQDKIRGCVGSLRSFCLPDLPESWEETMAAYLFSKTMHSEVPSPNSDLREVVLACPVTNDNRISADIQITLDM